MSAQSVEPLVLMYHGLDPGDDRYANTQPWKLPYILPADTFDSHLKSIHSADRKCFDPKHFSLEEKKSGPMQDGQILLTFDDGMQSDFDVAWSLLKKNNATALFFLTTARVGMNDRLNWEQVREMADEGAVFGAHGVTHAFFDHMTQDQQEEEMKRSFAHLQAQIGHAPWAVSLPGGRYNRHTFAAARTAGFRAVFTSKCKAPMYKNGLWVVGRVAIRKACTPEGFAYFLKDQKRQLTRICWGECLRNTVRTSIGSRRYDRLYRWLWNRREKQERNS